jgi:two-component system response regulator FixJ
MTAPTVFLVDDDPAIRYSIPVLLATANLPSECFASGEEFLSVCDSKREGCLLLDVRMPGMSGTELQQELARRQIHLPIIFMTAYADLATGVEAMKQGAADFLAKPINGAKLLAVVHSALDRNQQERRAETGRRQFETRLLKLTSREREVLRHALSGMANKEIAQRLNTSLRTIEGHRARIYLKTDVASLLELAHKASAVGVNLAGLVAVVSAAG